MALATVTDWDDVASFCTVTVTSTVALVAVMVGVVTRVPVYATRTGFTVFSQTCR